ncbi:Ubiquinone biosynthesis monooxygenase UbiB [Pedobacter cryoconitis]|uniref:Ubiquinone biosynthesis monooxygenase UbiB n=1 Tax=Pedobacter cryoconitis TaxID=188932 RepID=A0A127VAJ6_9SPHI|nr:AarF/UbiB family protein [Pedobacter cryoconitis]AMP98191.1 Ubiquinone biosynthesis monooxygenase UbiB [Pedobacter cryoconitis]
MMENQKRKLKRTASLVKILAKYGFEELLNNTSSEASLKDSSLSVYERIRMALEELGPTYVKFGQAFSSREDLLPKEMIVELQKLQDKVESRPMDVRELLKTDLGIDPDEFFTSIAEEPFASASISQVYKAELKNGQSVILKIKRPGIREVVASDMLIMKDIAGFLTSYSEVFRRINLVEVLEAFEKSIFQELSFLNELANIERFSRNFKGNEAIYLAGAYPELSNDSILCMEFIAGAKITDKEAIISMGLSPEKITHTGLDLYLIQVLEHGFFHADPHPGNLLVMQSGKIAFIDFGSMGSMMPTEKVMLEDFVSYFMAEDARRLIATMKKMAIRFNVADESKLERDIHEFFNLLDGVSLEQMDIKEVLTKFSAILNNNEILMPDHLYLLVRGIVLIEGIGRALVPDLNILDGLRPYILKIALKRLSPEELKKSGLKLLRTLTEALKTMPDDVQSIISKLNNGDLKVVQEVKGLPALKTMVERSLSNLSLSVFLSGLLITSAILILADKPPKFNGIPILALSGLVISLLIGIVILVQAIFKRK